jgi:type II secretory pathway predicted ATPase ExeA
MVATHFGLRQRPFPATPDSSAYYPATSHERALARLHHGLTDGEGLLLLTGAPGTGKTLLGHCLLERLGPTTRSAFLTHGHFPDRAGLLQAILYDLCLPYEGRGEQELRLALTDHLLENYAASRPTVLLLDEAHHLGPDLLEELRLLGNLEARGGKALQAVLLAQPPLRETLRHPGLASLRQRLAVRVELDPLGVEEAADYLLHHLRQAGGGTEPVLTDEALELLARGTHGVPRLLNQAAHQAMVLAQEAGAGQVDVEAALEALAGLGLEVGPGPAMEVVAPVHDEPAQAVEGLAVEAVVPLSGDGAEGSEGAADPSCRLFVEPGRPA